MKLIIYGIVLAHTIATAARKLTMRRNFAELHETLREAVTAVIDPGDHRA